MSDGTFRIGFAGLTHGHVWGLIEKAKEAGVKLVAVADETELLEKGMASFDKSYDTWREMLRDEKLDGIVVTTNNLEGAQVAIEALEKGISCFVEKPMATNAADADRMLAAAEKSGATLMVNWPLMWSHPVTELASIIGDGAIGPVFHLKFRVGHRGPREIGCEHEFVDWLYNEELNGGGAIADFGSYGACLSRWLLGMPDGVFCVKGNYTKDYSVSDDHALIVLKYPKASAVLEGTWATIGSDPGANPLVHGKTGSVGIFNREIETTKIGEDPVRVAAPPLVVSNPIAYFVKCVEEKRQPEGMLNANIAADACRILDAAKKSAESGCLERP